MSAQLWVSCTARRTRGAILAFRYFIWASIWAGFWLRWHAAGLPNFTAGASVFQPGKGFQQILTNKKLLYTPFVVMTLTY